MPIFSKLKELGEEYLGIGKPGLGKAGEVVKKVTEFKPPIFGKETKLGKVQRFIFPIEKVEEEKKEREEKIAKKELPAIARYFPTKTMMEQGVVGAVGGLETGLKKPTMGAVETIIQALKETKPIRGKQEALYTAERAKRIAKVVAMGEKVPGEKGFFAQLGQLKGEMPKVQFESIRNKIKQTDIDSLFDNIEKTEVLSPFEKVTTKGGLAKLLGAEGGSVPTSGELKLLSEVFPKEFIETVLAKRPLAQKLWAGAEQVLNLPRAVMATADLSAPLRQGIFLIGRQKQWLPAFKDMFKYAFSEKAYTGMMEKVKARPTYKLMRENNLSLTEMTPILASREEAFMSNLAEKIPVFGKLARGSNRAYSGFLNKLRADVFDDLYNKALKQNLVEDNPKLVSDIANFVNAATGRGDLGRLNRAATVLNGVLFSPRLLASRIQLLRPDKYIQLDPFVRKEALKSLFSFAGVGATVLGLAKLGGADVGIDPRSTDFGKIKIGNTRYDTWGGFQQYIVLASRLITGKMVSSVTGKEFTLGEGYKPTTRLDIIQRFFESKSAPVMSFALGLLKGKTIMGEEFKASTEIADRFIPMVVQDAYDLMRERGPESLAMTFPAIFGIGSQTYADLVPLESKTATGKPTIKWRQIPSLGETIISRITGEKITEVPVKKIYDEAQRLLKEGKKQEAKLIVAALTPHDYELYKKFKARDQRIRTDEIKARMTPLYQKNKKLLQQGKREEAQRNVDALTDEEYKIYQQIKEIDYRLIE